MVAWKSKINAEKLDRKSTGCEIEFKVKENKIRLKFLQQDQILYLELVLSAIGRS